MAITQLPTAPNRQNPSTFADNADTFLGALSQFVTEANALETNVNSKEASALSAADTATVAKDLTVTKSLEAENSSLSAAQSKQDAETIVQSLTETNTLNFIVKPIVTNPTNGATDFIGQLIVDGFNSLSTYKGVQDYVEWEAATDSNFSTIVDSYSGNSNLTSWTPSIGLALTQIFVRTKQGSDNHLSSWSDVISFTTPDTYVETPTLTVDGTPSDVPETPTLTTSAFSVYNGTDTHASTDWEVVRDSDSVVVWSSLADTTNLLSVSVPAGILTVSTAYTFKAKHNGTTYGSSSFASTAGTTKANFIVPLQPAGSWGYGTAPSSEDFASIGLSEMTGTNTVGDDNYGNYQHSNGSIMCYIPKTYYRIGHTDNPTYADYGANSIDTKGIDTFATEADANAAGYALHRAFIDNGVEKKGVFVDKYMNSKHSDGTQSVSVFGGDPISLTSNADYNPSSDMTNATGILADAVTIAKARGSEYISMAYYHYGLLALLSVAHAQATTDVSNNAWYDANGTTNYPKGCNSSLADVDDSSVTYTTAGDAGTADKPKTGATANFNKTTHNGCANGVADLNGGLYEVAIGLTSAGNSTTATTAIANDTIHILKLSSKLADLTGGWDGTNDAWGNTTHLDTLFDSVTSPHALGSTTGTVYWGSGTNGVFPSDLSGVNRDICGFIPKDNNATDDTGTNQFGNDYLYRYNIMNMAALCCGYWSHSATAGLYSRNFYSSRSYGNSYCSFRSLAYVS